MLSILERINQFLWGLPLLFLLAGSHLYFTIRLRFPQKLTLKAIRLSVTPEGEDGSGPSGFAALATTLAATLGTGNIIGVSTAVAVGGPGALFWCWITGIFGMATCYGECYLSVLFRARRKDGSFAGGPMYVLEKGLHSRPLGMLYAFCVLLAAFGVGCTTQASAITEAAGELAPVSPHLVGILAAVTAGLVILGGVRSIASFCTRMVPALGFFISPAVSGFSSSTGTVFPPPAPSSCAAPFLRRRPPEALSEAPCRAPPATGSREGSLPTKPASAPPPSPPPHREAPIPAGRGSSP